MVSFDRYRFPKEIILYAVYCYLRYSLSYRDVEELLGERDIKVDHATVHRWVVHFSVLVAQQAQRRKRPTGKSWRMDETYVKVNKKWCYLYRAIDKYGDTIDFMLSEERDEKAATAFFKQAVDNNGFPNKVVIDKSGANEAGLHNVNILLMLCGIITWIEILQVKYLNNRIEQDHRFIKKITKPMMGFKEFHCAHATLTGIETVHMIRKGQFNSSKSFYEQFADLAA